MIVAISCLIVLCLLALILIRKFPFMVFSSFVLYSIITKSASVFYLESVQSFISETEVHSFYIGASWRHLAYNILIIVLATVAGTLIRPVDIRKAEVSVGTYRLFFVLASSLLFLQMSNVLGSGFAFSGQRHVIWDNVPIPLLRDFLGVLVAFAPFFAGILLGKGIARNQFELCQLGLTLFALYVAFLAVSSQGFNGLLIGVLMGGLPCYAILSKIDRLPRLRLWISAIILVPFMTIYSSQGMEERGISEFSDGSTFGTAIYRIFVLQGGVYYTTDQIVHEEGAAGSLQLLLGDMDILLERLLKPDLAEAYRQKSVNLAGSLPGSAILTFGYFWAIPILGFYGVLLGLVCRNISNSLTWGHPLVGFLNSYILLWTATVYSRGSFATLLDAKFLVASFLVLVLTRYWGNIES